MDKKEENVVVEKTKSNTKIEEIISDYPQSLVAHPRGAFEEQLRKHLIKHKVQ